MSAAGTANFPDDVNRLLFALNLCYRLQVKILNIAIIIGCLLAASRLIIVCWVIVGRYLPTAAL